MALTTLTGDFRVDLDPDFYALNMAEIQRQEDEINIGTLNVLDFYEQNPASPPLDYDDKTDTPSLKTPLDWKNDEQVRAVFQKQLNQRIKEDFSDSGCSSLPDKNTLDDKKIDSSLSLKSEPASQDQSETGLDYNIEDYVSSFRKYGAYFPELIPKKELETKRYVEKISAPSSDASATAHLAVGQVNLTPTATPAVCPSPPAPLVGVNTVEKESLFYKSSDSDIRNKNEAPPLDQKQIEEFNKLPWRASVEEPFELGPPPKGNAYLNQFPGSLYNSFGRVFFDDSEIDLFLNRIRNSRLPAYFFIALFLIILLILCYVFEVSSFFTSLLVGFVTLLMYLLSVSCKEFWIDLKHKLERKRNFFHITTGFKAWLLYPSLQDDRAEIRKHFANLLPVPVSDKPPPLMDPHLAALHLFDKPDVDPSPQKDVSDTIEVDIKTNIISPFSPQGIAVDITPDHLKDFETESMMEELKYERKNPADFDKEQIQKSVKTLLIDNRPFLDVGLPNGTLVRAMLDTGSTSCCIHPRVFEELTKTHPIPVINTKCKITGVVPGVSSEKEKVALINLKIGDKIYPRVPSIIHDSGTDYLIGSNLIIAGKFSQFWNGPDYYVQLGLDKSPSKRVRVHFQKSSVLSACVLEDITLDPQQYNVFPLHVPEFDGLRHHNFKSKSLSVRMTNRNKFEDGFILADALATLTPEGNVCAFLMNDGVAPITLLKGTEVGTVEIAQDQGDLPNIFDPTPVRNYHKIVRNVEIDTTAACYCDALKDKQCLILFTDVFGHTYTQYNCIAKNGVFEPLKTGFILEKSDNNSHILYVTPDSNNSFEGILLQDIIDIVDKAKSKGVSAFYFYDNIRTDLSISQLKVLALMQEKTAFKRIVFDKQYLEEGVPFHHSCFPVGFAFPPSILTGCSSTSVHFQLSARAPDSAELTMRTSKEHEIALENTRVLFYRSDSTLVCHVHPPNKGITNVKLQKIVYSLFKGLRSIMCSTQFSISLSIPMGQDPAPKWNIIREAIGKVSSFQKCSTRCLVLLRTISKPSEISITCRTCYCALCNFKRNRGCILDAEAPVVFQGDINTLTNKNRDQISIQTKSHISSINQQEVHQIKIAKMVISTCDNQEEEVFDLPQDPLNNFDEKELQEFLAHLPGTIAEPEDFDDTKHDWRDFVDTSGVPPHLKAKFDKLMDDHYELFAFNKNHHTKFIKDGDEPAICDMELKTDRPIFTKSYPLSSKMAAVLDDKIDELLARDEIERIVSDYNSPILLVAHNSDNKHKDFKDKKFRLCIDLRIINSQILMKNRFSFLVSGVQLLYEKLHGHQYFTKIDMSKAYRSLLCSKRMQEMCAFRAPYSNKYSLDTFAFKSIPDGWALAPEQYSLFIKKALSQESRDRSICHIDDVLVTSPDADQHLTDVSNVFRDLMKANFMLSLPKFQTFQKSVLFLGHIVNGDSITIPEERKSYFDTLQKPTTKKELQSVLGLANYMACHLDSYQLKVGPLFDCMKNKDDKTVFELDELQSKAFEELKLAIRLAPSIHLMDFNKTLYVECDASISGTGSLLYQSNGTLNGRNIIRFGSKRYSLPETLQMTSLDREGNAIVVAAFVHDFYIRNSHDVVFKTDLKPLISILSCYNDPDSSKMRNISHKLYSLSVRWSLVHTPGTSIAITDALSRIYTPYRCAFTEKVDNSLDNIIIPEDWTLCPNLILTTADIVEAIRRQIVFIEKSSPAVKVKRLKALQGEVERTKHLIGDKSSDLSTIIEGNLSDFNEMVIEMRKTKRLLKEKEKEDNDPFEEAEVSALKLAPVNLGCTVFEKRRFLAKSQNEDPALARIKQNLLLKNDVSKEIRKRYRILNETLLVTRKKMDLPFDHPHNLQVVCNQYMGLVMLAIFHIFGGHQGINNLAKFFSFAYKVKNLYGLCKAICLSCQGCMFERHSPLKPLPSLRIPIPSVPMDTWYMDHMVFKNDTFFKGQKVAACLTILDGYSNLFQAYMVKNLTSKEVIENLKTSFSLLSPPLKMVSDNASPLISEAVTSFLKNSGVKIITTITPYNSRANLVERAHKTFRELISLNGNTFKRKNKLELFHHCVQQMNTRTLTRAIHPYIQSKIEIGEIITPFSLHFGSPPQKNELNLEDQMDDATRLSYMAKWQKIIKEHDKMLQDELEARLKKFKTPPDFSVGSLVLLQDMTHHKEDDKYYKNIYEIVDIKKAKFYVKPLFGPDKPFFVNGNNLKRYTSDILLHQLPPDIRNLLGEHLDPDALKKCSEDDRNNPPKDFVNWRVLKNIEPVQLRHRLFPPSVDSIPALEVEEKEMSSVSSSDSSDSFLFGPGGPLHQPPLPNYTQRAFQIPPSSVSSVSPSVQSNFSQQSQHSFDNETRLSSQLSRFSHDSLHSIHDSLKNSSTSLPSIVSGPVGHHNISSSKSSSKHGTNSSSNSGSDPGPPPTAPLIKYILRSKEKQQPFVLSPLPPRQKRTHSDSGSTPSKSRPKKSKPQPTLPVASSSRPQRQTQLNKRIFNPDFVVPPVVPHKQQLLSPLPAGYVPVVPQPGVSKQPDALLPPPASRVSPVPDTVVTPPHSALSSLPSSPSTPSLMPLPDSPNDSKTSLQSSPDHESSSPLSHHNVARSDSSSASDQDEPEDKRSSGLDEKTNRFRQPPPFTPGPEFQVPRPLPISPIMSPEKEKQTSTPRASPIRTPEKQVFTPPSSKPVPQPDFSPPLHSTPKKPKTLSPLAFPKLHIDDTLKDFQNLSDHDLPTFSPVPHVSFLPTPSFTDSDENETTKDKQTPAAQSQSGASVPPKIGSASRPLLTKEEVKRRLDFSKTIHPSKIKKLADLLSSGDESMKNTSDPPEITKTSPLRQEHRLDDVSMLSPDVSSTTDASMPSPAHNTPLFRSTTPAQPQQQPGILPLPSLVQVPYFSAPVPSHLPASLPAPAPLSMPPFASPLRPPESLPPASVPLQNISFTPHVQQIPLTSPSLVAKRQHELSTPENQKIILAQTSPQPQPTALTPPLQSVPAYSQQKLAPQQPVSSPIQTAPAAQPEVPVAPNPPLEQGRPKRTIKRPARYFGQEYQTEIPDPKPSWIPTPEKIKQKPPISPPTPPPPAKRDLPVTSVPPAIPTIRQHITLRPPLPLPPVATTTPAIDPTIIKGHFGSNQMPKKIPLPSGPDSDSIKSVSFSNPVDDKLLKTPEKDTGIKKSSLNTSLKELIQRALPILKPSSSPVANQPLNNSLQRTPPKSILIKTPSPKQKIQNETITLSDSSMDSAHEYEDVSHMDRSFKTETSSADSTLPTVVAPSSESETDSPYDPHQDKELLNLMKKLKERHAEKLKLNQQITDTIKKEIDKQRAESVYSHDGSVDWKKAKEILSGQDLLKNIVREKEQEDLQTQEIIQLADNFINPSPQQPNLQSSSSSPVTPPQSKTPQARSPQQLSPGASPTQQAVPQQQPLQNIVSPVRIRHYIPSPSPQKKQEFKQQQNPVFLTHPVLQPASQPAGPTRPSMPSSPNYSPQILVSPQHQHFSPQHFIPSDYHPSSGSSSSNASMSPNLSFTQDSRQQKATPSGSPQNSSQQPSPQNLTINEQLEAPNFQLSTPQDMFYNTPVQQSPSTPPRLLQPRRLFQSQHSPSGSPLAVPLSPETPLFDLSISNRQNKSFFSQNPPQTGSDFSPNVSQSSQHFPPGSPLAVPLDPRTSSPPTQNLSFRSRSSRNDSSYSYSSPDSLYQNRNYGSNTTGSSPNRTPISPLTPLFPAPPNTPDRRILHPRRTPTLPLNQSAQSSPSQNNSMHNQSFNQSFNFNDSLRRQPGTPPDRPVQPTLQSTPVRSPQQLIQPVNQLSPILSNQPNQILQSTPPRPHDVSMQNPNSPLFNQSLQRQPVTPPYNQTSPQAMNISPQQNQSFQMNLSDPQFQDPQQHLYQQQQQPAILPPPPEVPPTARGRPRGRPRGSRSSSRGSIHNFNRYHPPETVRTHPYQTRSGRTSRPPKRYGQDD